jgi:hypothetical protein
MLFNLYLQTSTKIRDNPMPSPRLLVIKPQLNLGELAVPFLVFLVSLVVALTVLAKQRLETCAVVAVCSRPPRHGDVGTEKSTRTKDVTLFALLLPPQLSLP